MTLCENLQFWWFGVAKILQPFMKRFKNQFIKLSLPNNRSALVTNVRLKICNDSYVSERHTNFYDSYSE